MPVSYQYLKEHSAVVVTATGVVTMDDLVGYINSLSKDERIDENHVTLFDASDIEDIAVTPEDIEKLFELQERIGRKVFAKKLAIIARGDKESSIAKIYEKLSSRMMERTILFFHIDLACRWLGFPEEAIPKNPTNKNHL
ncbi:MAG: hypothetical protein ACE14Q_08855 [Acidobacteriota bacterium]